MVDRPNRDSSFAPADAGLLPASLRAGVAVPEGDGPRPAGTEGGMVSEGYADVGEHMKDWFYWKTRAYDAESKLAQLDEEAQGP